MAGLHLHLFDVRGVLYGDVAVLPGEIGDEETFTVGDASAEGGMWCYQYDFGDGWDQHVSTGSEGAS